MATLFCQTEATRAELPGRTKKSRRPNIFFEIDSSRMFTGLLGFSSDCLLLYFLGEGLPTVNVQRLEETMTINNSGDEAITRIVGQAKCSSFI